ncbi:MAG: ABC transporter substrate-binding protein [Candidatus Limivivens sp.]|nr:ABC transporter substrate-binding protein [Candidatus Limivivens sp.]
MRKKILALILAAAMAFSASGTVSFAEENTGKHVGVLKIGTTKAADSFNSMSEGGSYGVMNYNSFSTAPFVQRGTDGAIQPFIMTSWEISEDKTSLTATFAVDQGITWHDGTPLTMDDIIFTFQYLREVKQSYYTSDITDVEQIDDQTLKLSFNGPKAYAALNCMATYVYVYPKHIWENIEDPKAYTGEDAIIGCGPYKVTDIDEEAQLITYEKAADTYLGREITVDKVQVRTYDGHEALVMALKTGEVDAMYDYSNSLDSSMKPSLTGVEGLDPGMSTNSGHFQLVFGFNETPTNDLAFRQAAAKALDYTLLAAAIGGEDGQIAGTGIVSPVVQGFNEELPLNEQDTEAAQAILEEAGYMDTDGDGFRELPDGSAMEVLITPQYNEARSALYARIAEIIIQNMGDIGVKAVLDEESVRNKDHCSEVRKSGTYQLYIGYTTPGVASFDSVFLYTSTCNLPEYTEKYEEFRISGSQEEYNENLKDLQQIAADSVIAIALCWDNAYFPFRTDKIGGWVNAPAYGGINVETWYSLYEK